MRYETNKIGKIVDSFLLALIAVFWVSLLFSCGYYTPPTPDIHTKPIPSPKPQPTRCYVIGNDDGTATTYCTDGTYYPSPIQSPTPTATETPPESTTGAETPVPSQKAIVKLPDQVPGPTGDYECSNEVDTGGTVTTCPKDGSLYMTIGSADTAKVTKAFTPCEHTTETLYSLDNGTVGARWTAEGDGGVLTVVRLSTGPHVLIDGTCPFFVTDTGDVVFPEVL